MNGHGDALAQARDAAAAGDWPTAAAQFDLLGSEQLTADDLAAHADAVWYLGLIDDVLRLGAAAYDAFLADSRPAEAAKSAMYLGIFHLGRGDAQQSTGWFGRAQRLADELPECELHGYLAFIEADFNLMRGETAAAIAAARRVQDVGDRLDASDLVAAGLHGEARAMIKSGQVADGLALLDEAMVTVLQGRVAPFLAFTLYCHAIAACHEVADLRRMSRWTELTEHWLASLPSATVGNAMCRVHRAQLQLLHGEWDQAEGGALRVVGHLDANRVDYAAEAWYVIAEVRRMRGDRSAADAYDEAHARGRDPQPGRALLRLQQGDVAGAATSVRSALAAVGSDPLRRAPICAAAVEIALAAGRLDDATAAESELAATAARYATSGLEAAAANARGAVLLAKGLVTEALPVLRDACRRWHELGAMYDAARTSLRLGEAYRAFGDEVSAAAEDAQAQATFERLGAHRPMPVAPDGLTQRECQVLALVADGHSNREIGEALFISDRTVARHLTNLFHKIGVTSRTQAARYALDRGIATSR